jgi:hypothetical protein
MSKKNVRPSVEFTQICGIALAHPGVSVEEKAGWIKVSGPHGDRGPRVYIQRKAQVRQVDLSMMGAPEGSFASDGKNGSVEAHLDLASPAWAASFAACLDLVASSTPVQSAKSKARPSLALLTKTGDSSPDLVAEATSSAALIGADVV